MYKYSYILTLKELQFVTDRHRAITYKQLKADKARTLLNAAVKSIFDLSEEFMTTSVECWNHHVTTRRMHRRLQDVICRLSQ